MPSQRDRDAERRTTVERYHQLKDREEDFAVAKAAATTYEERRRLDSEMYAFRSAHRKVDQERGKRAPGLVGIRMHQIMWARWCEISVRHELEARTAFARIVKGETEALVDELRQSLVAIAAAASTIEAIYEDVRFLVPERPYKRATYDRISDLLGIAFGLPSSEKEQLVDNLKWLFRRRNEGVHPYAEPEAPQVHPSGVNTSAEASRFNADESRRAVDIAMSVLQAAESPPAPYSRWVERWVTERATYQDQVVAPLRAMRDAFVADAESDRSGSIVRSLLHLGGEAAASVRRRIKRS